MPFKYHGFVICMLCCSAFALPAIADDATLKDRLHAARAHMDQGKEGLSERQLRDVLMMKDISEETRFEAELLLARILEPRHGESINAAVAQYQRLLRYYKKYILPSEVHFKLAKLFESERRHTEVLGELEHVVFSERPSMRAEARLLKAKTLYNVKQYDAARMTLLSILSRPIPERMRCLSMAWLAAVDYRAGRDDVAIERFGKVFGQCEPLIKQEIALYSSYIEMLVRNSRMHDAEQHLDAFLSRYFDARESRALSLLYADMIAERGDLNRAIILYGNLSAQTDDMDVARKAKLRSLMLLTRRPVEPYPLKTAIAAITELAVAAPLTPVEVEANVNRGLLFWQLHLQYPGNEEYAPRALAYLMLAESSKHPEFAEQAKQQGRHFIDQWLHLLAEDGQWANMIATWEHYPVFVSEETEMLLLMMDAYREMGLYDKAQHVLDALKQRGDARWSNRLKVEQARLWFYAGDKNLFEKTTPWLNSVDDLSMMALYMMRAQTRMDANQLELAREELSLVPLHRLGKQKKAYWTLRAAVYEAMDDWRLAADALRQLADDEHAERSWDVVAPQVRMLMREPFCEDAISLLDMVPEQERQSEWYVFRANCALQLGDAQQSETWLKQARTAEGNAQFQLEIRGIQGLIDAEKLKEMRQ